MTLGKTLTYAAFVEPRPILLVFALYMVGEPVAQKVQQLNVQGDFAPLKPGDELFHLAGQFAVFSAVRSQLRVTRSCHHRLLG